MVRQIITVSLSSNNIGMKGCKLNIHIIIYEPKIGCSRQTILFLIQIQIPAAHWRSEQLLSTERSRDLIELSPIQKSFRRSAMIHTLVRQTGRATTSFRPGRSPGLKRNGE